MYIPISFNSESPLLRLSPFVRQTRQDESPKIGEPRATGTYLNPDRQVYRKALSYTIGGLSLAHSRLGNDRAIFGNYRDYLIYLAANDFSLQGINLDGQSCRNACRD